MQKFAAKGQGVVHGKRDVLGCVGRWKVGNEEGHAGERVASFAGEGVVWAVVLGGAALVFCDYFSVVGHGVFCCLGGGR